MKRVAFLSCMFLALFSTSRASLHYNYSFPSDTLVTFTGRVLGPDNRPLENVSVLLQTQDSVISAATISDADGVFSLAAEKSKVKRIEFRQVGYSSTFLLINHTQTNIALGDVVLKDRVQELNEVVVVSRRPFLERRIDRTVVNVADHVRQIGGNATDAIKLAPGVKTTNGSISIAGKGTVLVMLNEKIIQLSGSELSQFLSTIPSESIQSIEVLTNPPAKYDASGNTGYINVVLKKSYMQGYSGTVSASLGKAIAAYGNFSGNFNYNTDRLKINISPSYGFNGFTTTSDQRIYFPELSWLQQDRTENKNRNVGVNFNSSYELSKKTVLEVLYNYSRSPNSGDGFNNSRFVAPLTLAADSLQETATKFGSTTQSHIIDISTTTKLDTNGAKLTIDANYFRRQQPSFRNFQTMASGPEQPIPTVFNEVNSTNAQYIDVYTTSADAVLPLGKWEFSSGGKAVFISSLNDAKYISSNALIESQNSLFDYSERTQALYANLKKTGTQLSMQLGLRGEYTQARGYSQSLDQENKYKIFQLFPTVFTSYKPGKDHHFSLTYGRRISRPGYGWVNPFRLYSSINSYQEGNPYLKPYYSHNFEFMHIFKDVLTTSAYYSTTKNKFDQLTIQEETDQGFIQGTVNRNFLGDKSFGITESYFFDKISWLESTTEVQLYYKKVTSTDPLTPREIKGTSAYLSTDNTISFNKKKTLKANISFWYQFPEVSGVDRVKRYYSLDLGLSGTIYKDRLSFGLNFSDVFKTANPSWTSLINNVPQYYYQYYDSRRFRVSLVFKFSRGKNSDNKKTKRNDEWNRA